MNNTNNKNIEKIVQEFGKIGEVPKNILKYGMLFFLILLASATILAVLNVHLFNFDPYIHFIALSIVKTSFTVLAEIIIGSLVIDYLSQKI